MELKRERIFRIAVYVILGVILLALPLYTKVPLVSLVTKVFIFALLTMSLDILVGYAGLWAFGHAAFFGIAAYTTGVFITRLDITSFWLSAPAGVLMAALVAAIFGLIALRVSAIYFLLITFALGQLVYSVAMKWVSVTRGSDGLGGVPYPDFGFSWYSPTGYYYFALAVFVICALILYRLVRSPFGASLQGIREDDIRMRTLGYNVWLHRYLTFIIGGLFAGVAGVLYVHYNGIITPGEVSVTTTGLIWLMLIIGGSGVLWGSLIGSAVIQFLQYYISMFTPERWPLIVGACFVASVMLLRGGIFHHLTNLWTKINRYGYSRH